ncbi:hypothetical protein BGZ76_011377 [Entomortierella beljakovae]|nr:hypothetical protein BGZ76_011377 [Entomortierella beljakovae]
MCLMKWKHSQAIKKIDELKDAINETDLIQIDADRLILKTIKNDDIGKTQASSPANIVLRNWSVKVKYESHVDGCFPVVDADSDPEEDKDESLCRLCSFEVSL